MVYMLLGTGFEETEAIAPLDLLRRAGIEVLTVGINGKTVYGGHGIGIEADITVGEMDLTAMDMIVLPGGLVGVASVRHALRQWKLCASPGTMASMLPLSVQVLRFLPTCTSLITRTLPAIPAVKRKWAAPIWSPMPPQ